MEDTGKGPEKGLSVVIPAYNEEDGIAAQVEAVHQVLSASGRSFEILVVDDGSTDGTARVAAGLPCRLIRQPGNFGYGAALKRGIAAAASESILIIDADGTYPAAAIPKLLEVSKDFDMVVGARTGQIDQGPMVRRPARWFITKLASFLAMRKIPDLNSGLRLFKKAHVRRFERILPSGFSFTTTITLALLCNEYRVSFVPIDYHRRVGQSKIRARDTWHFSLLIVRAMCLFNPLRVFLPLGTAFFLVGVGKFIYDCFLENLSETAVMGILGGILIWAFGLLADQNARLGLERRPWDAP